MAGSVLVMWLIYFEYFSFLNSINDVNIISFLSHSHEMFLKTSDRYGTAELHPVWSISSGDPNCLLSVVIHVSTFFEE